MMSEREELNDNGQLDELLQQYRRACPEVEPSVHFMPELWAKIDARRGLWFHFGNLGKSALTLSSALCVLLLVLNLSEPPQVAANYADALLSDDSTQQVFYSETVAPVTPVDPGNVRH